MEKDSNELFCLNLSSFFCFFWKHFQVICVKFARYIQDLKMDFRYQAYKKFAIINHQNSRSFLDSEEENLLFKLFGQFKSVDIYLKILFLCTTGAWRMLW